MLRQYRHTLKQILAERADGLSVLRQLLLSPSIGHGPQQRDQRRGRGDHDFLREPLLDDGAIIFQRRPQKLLPRQEQDDELGSLLELTPVRFGAQLVHSRANLRRVLPEPFTPHFIVLSLHGLQVRSQYRFGIHDNLAAGRQLDNHIGAQAACLSFHGLLLAEVAVLNHAGQLRHALERDLSPLPSYLRRPQGLDEIAGLLLQPLVGLRQRLEVLIQPAIRGLPGSFHIGNLGFVSLEGFVKRLNETFNRLLTLG